jgi:hypothetical protein
MAPTNGFAPVIGHLNTIKVLLNKMEAKLKGIPYQPSSLPQGHTGNNAGNNPLIGVLPNAASNEALSNAQRATTKAVASNAAKAANIARGSRAATAIAAVNGPPGLSGVAANNGLGKNPLNPNASLFNGPNKKLSLNNNSVHPEASNANKKKLEGFLSNNTQKGGRHRRRRHTRR